jgi:hypothetical protein
VPVRVKTIVSVPPLPAIIAPVPTPAVLSPVTDPVTVIAPPVRAAGNTGLNTSYPLIDVKPVLVTVIGAAIELIVTGAPDSTEVVPKATVGLESVYAYCCKTT